MTRVVGDAARVEVLFSRHYRAVLSYARRRTSDEMAEDVASQVFMIVWRRASDVPDDAIGWLIATARNVLANERRSEERRTALNHRLERERVTPTVSSDERLETAERWSAALQGLSSQDRELLTLIAWDGLTNRQAAESLGCGQTAFRMRLSRARRRLLAGLAATDETGREIAATMRRERSTS